MDQVMNLVKLNKFNLLKKEVEEFGQQRKNLDSVNKRLEYNRNFKGSKSCLWVYSCFIFLRYK